MILINDSVIALIHFWSGPSKHENKTSDETNSVTDTICFTYQRQSFLMILVDSLYFLHQTI